LQISSSTDGDSYERHAIMERVNQEEVVYSNRALKQRSLTNSSNSAVTSFTSWLWAVDRTVHLQSLARKSSPSQLVAEHHPSRSLLLFHHLCLMHDPVTGPMVTPNG
jgi:hypothetical protein